MVGCDDKMNRYDEQIKESINKWIVVMRNEWIR
jgi:hypothetical protein